MKFNIRFVNNEAGGKDGVLVVDNEAMELLGDNISCQICGAGLKGEIFYFCKELKKWYCKKCTFNDRIVCPAQTWKNPEHPHFCIKHIEVKD